jgi:tetratricopeptide (TPR) repeat protein
MRPLALASLAVLLAACGTPRSAGAPLATPPPTAAAAQPSPDVLVARARAVRAEGDVAGARARLEAAAAAAPDHDGARLELADLLLADGTELDRAAALLAGVRTPGFRGQLLSARLAELRGDDAGAADAYARALASGDDPDVRLRRALALDRLGRAGEATTELERVRAERPDDAIAGARLAALYERAGRLREAEAEYRALAEARPDRVQGWDELARFCERAGRHAEARVARERAKAARGTASARDLRPLLPSKR